MKSLVFSLSVFLIYLRFAFVIKKSDGYQHVSRLFRLSVDSTVTFFYLNLQILLRRVILSFVGCGLIG